MFIVNAIVYAVTGFAVIFLAASYLLTGEVEPCKALAAERAAAAEQSGSLIGALGFDLQLWHRRETSQLSTGACMAELAGMWQGRLTQTVAGTSGGN